MISLQHLEELTFNALPAPVSLHYDGWVLRAGGGAIRRANSVNVLHNGTLPVAEKIAHCEDFYRRRGTPVIFRLNDESAWLGEPLAARGYTLDPDPTLMMTAPLAAPVPPPSRPAVIEPHGAARWFDTLVSWDRLTPDTVLRLRAMLGSLALPAAFVAVPDLDDPRAIGLGVLERGWVGAFDVSTRPDARQQGYATDMMRHILTWAQAHGAAHAYLQVHSRNTPALRLYAKLGYRQVYRYTYWSRA